ncbi:MAG: hypothetical protein CL569_00185 [Alphaproteobacteria bacterium]|nr:hypothetical protein [Alphaproteobacteria bacterium]
MTPSQSAPQTLGQNAQPLWLFPILLLVLLQVAMVWRNPGMLENRQLLDADGYTRLARVEALADGGGWYDDAAVRANVPYGTTLHWTRPFDLLLLAVALPLVPFTSINSALYWSGALINPVLLVMTLAALMWAVKPLLRREDIPYFGVLVLALPAVHAYFGIGRADHHGLILLLFVVLLGTGVRALTAEADRGPLIATGLAAALSVWVSVEALVAIAVVLLSLTVSWVARDRPGTRGLTILSFCLWLVVIIGLVVERAPNALLVVEYDRLSIVHVFVLGLPALFFASVAVMEGRFPTWSQEFRRLAVTVAGAFFGCGMVALIFPQFFDGPYVDVDPRVVTVWLERVQEVRPLISPEHPLRTAREIVFLLGHAIVGLPVQVWIVLNQKGSQRQAWILIALATCAYVPLTLYQARWAAYAEFLLVIPYAVLMGIVLDGLRKMFADFGASAALVAVSRAGVVVVFTCTFLVIGALLHRLEAASGFRPNVCSPTGVATYLGSDPHLARAPRRVLAFVFDGPEIAYRSPHFVVATPYQRNTSGILDTYGFFTATDEAQARDIIERRRIDLVLLCRQGNEAEQYRGEGSGMTIYDRLLGQSVPAWLRPIQLSETLAATYSLFEVVR